MSESNGKMSPKQILEAVQRLKVVGDPSRAALLLLLADGQSLNVGEISETLDQNRPTVSHHLSLLRIGGLAEALRNGKERYYRLTERGEKAVQWLQEAGRSTD